MKSEHWWHIYGPFDPGEDNLPSMGQVIAHYARLSGLKTAEIAQRLSELGWAIGERRMEQILSDNNKREPQAISRRKVLAKVLAIPVALLGLAGSDVIEHISQVSRKPPAIDSEALMRYESVLRAYWESFYSNTIHRHSDGIQNWIGHLKGLVDQMTAHKTEVLTLQCQFDQLSGVEARDKGDLAAAYFAHNRAIEIAQELGNAELLAAGYFRRSKDYIAQGKVESAIEDLKKALVFARRSRDNLKGYVYQTTGYTITLLPLTSETKKQFQQFMDEAGRILRKGAIESDSSYAQLSLAGYHQDRARGYLNLGDTESAFEAIIQAEKTKKPDMLRWQAKLQLLKARAYFQQGEIEWACRQLEEVYLLTRVMQSSSLKKSSEQLFDFIASRYGNQPEVRRLRPLIKG